MEYTFAEVLTREELINILNERQLNLPNIQQMPHCDLIRIYRSFALPLARRELHRRARNILAYNDNDAVVNTENDGVCSMDIDELENTKLSTKNPNAGNNMLMEKPLNCEKRSRDYKHLNPLTDEYLSIATKRIKIAWS